MAERITVTLDGPAGVGKTTLARQCAENLGIAYLDTGAMFRAVAYSLGKGSWELEDDELLEKLNGLSFDLKGVGGASELYADGKLLGEEIRSEKVGLWASNIATRPVIREFLKKAQREIGGHVSLVVEGRDMGTVVFPEASHKFFLDATPEERAYRRYLQLKEMGEDADLDKITLQLKVRDAQDRNREVAPLRPAEDAIIVDTTSLDINGVLAEIMKHLKK